MNRTEFDDLIEDVKTMLENELGILQESARCHVELDNHCHKFENIEEYGDIYLKERNTYNYNFLLYDESLLHLQYDPKNKYNHIPCDGEEPDIPIDESKVVKYILRYCYLESPYNEYLSYNEYLMDKGLSFDEVEDAYMNDYTQYMKQYLKENATYIRYDYSIKQYKEGCHGVSHFHLGFSDSIRLTSDKILAPEAFTLFILKQVYYDDLWKLRIPNDKLLTNRLLKLKDHCESITNDYLNKLDISELYFT